MQVGTVHGENCKEQEVITPEEIQKLRELYEHATPGEWLLTPKDNLYFESSLYIDREGDGRGVGIFAAAEDQNRHKLYGTDDDLALMVFLHNVGEDLLDTIEQQAAKIKKLEAENLKVPDLLAANCGLRAELANLQSRLASYQQKATWGYNTGGPD
jgi:hypothetical protein